MIAAHPDFVWDRLNDPQVLEQSITGCESMRVTGEGEFVAGLKLRFGPVTAAFDGRLSLSNVVDNRSYTITFEGLGGVAGSGRGTADIRLELERGATRVLYAVEARIGGRVGRLGQRLVDHIARKMIDDFFSSFENVIVDATRRDGAPRR